MKGCCRSSSWHRVNFFIGEGVAASMKGCCRSSSWSNQDYRSSSRATGLNEGLLPKQQLAGDAHLENDLGEASMKGCCRSSSWEGEDGFPLQRVAASMKGCCRSSSWAPKTSPRALSFTPQ